MTILFHFYLFTSFFQVNLKKIKTIYKANAVEKNVDQLFKDLKHVLNIDFFLIFFKT